MLYSMVSMVCRYVGIMSDLTVARRSGTCGECCVRVARLFVCFVYVSVPHLPPDQWVLVSLYPPPLEGKPMAARLPRQENLGPPHPVEKNLGPPHPFWKETKET